MPKRFMFSAFTTPEGLAQMDYSKDYLWANDDGGSGYATFSHDGQALFGPLVSAEFPTSTSVKATYKDQNSGQPFVLEVDSQAKTATITQGDVIIHDALYPPYPSYLSLTDDTAQAASGS